jgi:hypothetical protein
MLPEPVLSFAVSPTPSTVMLPEPEPAEQRILRRLNLVVDADVVQVLVMAPDAHNVARLLDGRVSRNLLHPLLAAAPAALHFAEDVHLVARAARQVNIPRPGRNR